MGAKIKYAALQVCFMLGALATGLAVFLVLAKLTGWIELHRIIRAELEIFSASMDAARRNFDRAYLVHTLLLYGFALAGGGLFIYFFFLRPLVPAFRFLYRGMIANGSKYRLQFIFTGLVLFFATVLLLKEYQLRHLAFVPGSAYAGNDFSDANPKISWTLLADGRGMNYFNPDSFHNKTDPTSIMVNSEGFPDAFDFNKAVLDSLCNQPGAKKKKLLFLGDSFAEGVGASTFDKSFMEIFRRQNPDKVVCNTGIGGMDPVQYRLVAQKYVPEILPDKVVVLFCGWNDICLTNQKRVPYLPYLEDIKGVGVIYDYIQPGVTESDTLTLFPDSAYKLYRRRFSLMGNEDLPAKCCRQSCVTTQIYYLFKPVKYYRVKLGDDSLATYRNLKAIKELTDSLHEEFCIVFIPTPVMQEYGMKEYEEHYKWVFRDLWPYVRFCPKRTVTASDCSTSVDYHFNDKGQKKFAGFLEKEMNN